MTMSRKTTQNIVLLSIAVVATLGLDGLDRLLEPVTTQIHNFSITYKEGKLIRDCFSSSYNTPEYREAESVWRKCEELKGQFDEHKTKLEACKGQLEACKLAFETFNVRCQVDLETHITSLRTTVSTLRNKVEVLQPKLKFSDYPTNCGLPSHKPRSKACKYQIVENAPIESTRAKREQLTMSYTETFIVPDDALDSSIDLDSVQDDDETSNSQTQGQRRPVLNLEPKFDDGFYPGLDSPDLAVNPEEPAPPVAEEPAAKETEENTTVSALPQSHLHPRLRRHPSRVMTNVDTNLNDESTGDASMSNDDGPLDFKPEDDIHPRLPSVAKNLNDSEDSSEPVEYSVGETVKAKWGKTNPKYYPATIISKMEDGNYQVKYTTKKYANSYGKIKVKSFDDIRESEFKSNTRRLVENTCNLSMSAGAALLLISAVLGAFFLKRCFRKPRQDNETIDIEAQ